MVEHQLVPTLGLRGVFGGGNRWEQPIQENRRFEGV